MSPSDEDLSRGTPALGRVNSSAVTSRYSDSGIAIAITHSLAAHGRSLVRGPSTGTGPNNRDSHPTLAKLGRGTPGGGDLTLLVVGLVGLGHPPKDSVTRRSNADPVAHGGRDAPAAGNTAGFAPVCGGVLIWAATLNL